MLLKMSSNSNIFKSIILKSCNCYCYSSGSGTRTGTGRRVSSKNGGNNYGNNYGNNSRNSGRNNSISYAPEPKTNLKMERIYWYNDPFLLTKGLEKSLKNIESVLENLKVSGLELLPNSNDRRGTDTATLTNVSSSRARSATHTLTSSSTTTPQSTPTASNADIRELLYPTISKDSLCLELIANVKSLLTRHVIAKEIHYSLAIASFLKLGLLDNALDLYQAMKEKKIFMNEKSLTSFFNGCIAYTQLHYSLQKKGVHVLELKQSFIDMVLDSWPTFAAVRKEAVNPIHASAFLNLLAWIHCNDFELIDSVMAFVVSFHSTSPTALSPQQRVFATSAYIKASSTCLFFTDNSDFAPSYCQNKRILDKVSKTFTLLCCTSPDESLGLDIQDSKLVAQYLILLYRFDKLMFSSAKHMRSKTALSLNDGILIATPKQLQQQHHALTLSAIHSTTGLCVPIIRKSQARTYTRLEQSKEKIQEKFKRFNDNYSLIRVLLAIESRIHKSSTYSYLSDPDFGRIWYDELVEGFDHGLMDAAQSLLAKREMRQVEEWDAANKKNGKHASMPKKEKPTKARQVTKNGKVKKKYLGKKGFRG